MTVYLSSALQRALVMGALLCVCWVMPHPTALAQSSLPTMRDVPQPPHVPRRVLVHAPVLHADHALDPRRTGLQEVSPRELRGRLARALQREPRWEVADDELLALFAEREAPAVERSLEAVARQGLRIGVDHFRVYNLAAAIESLQAGLESAAQTRLRWEEPELLAEGHFMLGLAHLAAADQANPDERYRHESAARLAFRQVHRLEPNRRIDRDSYPNTVLAVWDRAVADHGLENGRGLGLQREEAAWLAQALGLDNLLHTWIYSSGNHAWVHVQLYDRASGRFVHEASRRTGLEVDAIWEVLDLETSRAEACVPPRAPPSGTRRQLPEELYLTSLFSVGTWLESPARTPFVAPGFHVSAARPLTEDLSLTAGTGFSFGLPDSDGVLIRRLDTLRFSLGLAYVFRWRRSRVHFGVSQELTRVSRVMATREFWCRVTEGEPVSFDDFRACTPDDIEERPGRWQMGAVLEPAYAWSFAGRFTLHAQLRMGVYLVPLDIDLPVDYPLGAEIGVGYRF